MVAVLLVGGAVGAFLVLQPGASRLTEAEAREKVTGGLLAVQHTFGGLGMDASATTAPATGLPQPDTTLSDLRKITIEASGDFASMGDGGGPGMPGSGGPNHMTMGIEWGTGSSLRLDVSVSSGFIAVTMSVYCTADGTVMSMGGKSVRDRPEVGKEPNCGELGGPSGPGSPGAMTPSSALPFELVAPPDMQVAVGDDTITATWTEYGNTTTLHMDRHGDVWRISAIDFASPKGAGSIKLDYGERQAITAPTGAELEPAKVQGVPSMKIGTPRSPNMRNYTWTVTESPQQPALTDFEVRIRGLSGPSGSPNGSPSDDTAPIFAVFPLAGGPPVENFTYSFKDADQDGKLTVGDSFTVMGTGQGWEAVVYDKAGHGDINTSHLMPAPAFLLVAAALCGSAWLRRRTAPPA